MNPTKLSFESENLQVDFLRFNLQFVDKYEIQEIAEYLSKEYSCNSVFIDQKKTYSLIEKVFDVEEFLDQFNISNSNLQRVKFYLLQTFELAQNSKFIENQFQLVLKTNRVKTVTKLTTNFISRTKFIYFNEWCKS